MTGGATQDPQARRRPVGDGPVAERRDGAGLRSVRSGPLVLELGDRELRCVRQAGTEVLNRVYVAVRDEAWGTVPAIVTEESFRSQDTRFDLAFSALHEADAVSFRWQGRIAGGSDGVITFAMDGVGLRDFPYRRIGLCVLLSTGDYAGHAYRGTAAAGVVSGEIPRLVAPQPVIDRQAHPMFDAVSELSVELPVGRAELGFTGDQFEMEDQRNWSDATFKIYSANPPARRDPWWLRAGDRIHQQVQFRLCESGREPPRARRRQPGPLGVTVDDEPGPANLALGIGLADGAEHTVEQAALVRALRPHHLRYELRPDTPAWDVSLRSACAQAAALGSPLELALQITDGAEDESLRALANALGARAAIARVLVYRADHEPTQPALVRLAEQHLRTVAAHAQFGGGSNISFAEVNRLRQAAGVLAFALSPQVHAEDERSIAETPGSVDDVVRTVRSFAPDAPIAVGPITLRMRFNPDRPQDAGGPAPLKDRVDPRQRSLFGAGWTTALLAALIRAQVQSATFFETVGPCGLMAAVPPSPEVSSSSATRPFASYHIFKAMADRRRPTLNVASEDPQTVAGLAWVGSGPELMLANLTGVEQVVAIHGHGPVRRLWLMDEDMPIGPGFAERAVTVDARTARLPPYAVAIVQLAAR